MGYVDFGEKGEKAIARSSPDHRPNETRPEGSLRSQIPGLFHAEGMTGSGRGLGEALRTEFDVSQAGPPHGWTPDG